MRPMTWRALSARPYAAVSATVGEPPPPPPRGTRYTRRVGGPCCRGGRTTDRLKEKEEAEETLWQQQDRLALESGRVPAPGPRAALPSDKARPDASFEQKEVCASSQKNEHRPRKAIRSANPT